MLFDYTKYQLNSYRHGLVTRDKLYGRKTIFFNCETQHESIYKIKHYQDLHKQGTHNIICIPVDINGKESGDNYEIYFYHENKLKTEFHVNEKLDKEHLFFKSFGRPLQNFTNYMFDSKLNFSKKTTSFEEVLGV
jgi:hypothetical protein